MKYLLITACVLVVAFLASVGLTKPNVGFLGSSAENRAITAVTSVYTVGPSANGTQTIATTSTGRTWMRIVATSTNVYLSYNGAYVAASREYLASPYVFDLDHMYTGAISAKADATTTVSVTTFSN